MIRSLMCVGLVALLSGCAGLGLHRGEGDHRMARYTPSVQGAPKGMPETQGPVETVPVEDDSDAGSQSTLSSGDQVMTFLRGIPEPEELKNVVNASGGITLPYIGQIQVAGLTPSEAERLVERMYVEQGIYRSINVIMVSEEKSYFVQGEVGRQGRYSMSGEVTLLKAIAEAGGYTPFANRRNVKIIRGDEVLFYNARDIAKGDEPDPVIEPNDIVVVLRSIL